MFNSGKDADGNERINIHFPEGDENVFTQSTSDPSLWLPPGSIGKRLTQNKDTFRLQTEDGHRFRFVKFINSKSQSYYLLQQILDEYQNKYTLTYDNKNRLIRIMEPAGRYVQIMYGILGGISVITKVNTSDGRSVQYNYDVFDDGLTTWVRLLNASYGDSTKASYTYSQIEAGSTPNLEHAIDPRLDGDAVNMRYIYDRANASGFIKEERNGKTGEVMASLDAQTATRIVCYPNGKIQKYFLPRYLLGQLDTYTDGLNAQSKYTYYNYGNGFMKSSTDELGRTTFYKSLSKYGNPKKITYPDGSTEEWERDNLDLVLKHTDELDRVTTYKRDVRHRIERIDYPDQAFETFTYNDFGQVVDHKRRNGGTEHSVYDAHGLRTSFQDALGNITQYTYDAADRLASTIDPLGHKTERGYDERGLTTTMTSADGSMRIYKYDAFGNQTESTDELKHQWRTTYDEFKRPVTVTDPLGRVTKYNYDLPGGVCGCTHGENKPTRIISPSGKVTEIEYDTEWEMIRKTVGKGSADEGTTFYEYDAAGNMVAVIDPRGKGWKTEYDARDRKKASIDPLGNQTEWGYDPVGNIVHVKRPDGSSIAYQYDIMNHQTQVTDPKNQITKMGYDAEDNQITLTDPNNHTYTFEYDLLNRNTKMSYPDGSAETYTYDNASNLKTYTTRAGQVRTYIYDNRDREITSRWSDNTPAIYRTYDAAGRLKRLVSRVSEIKYTYDGANALTSETQTIAGAAPHETIYTTNKDALRNSIRYPDGTIVTYKYNGRNDISSILNGTDTLARYSYDFNGNRIVKTLKNNTATFYTYDDANRTLSVDNRAAGISFGRFDYGYDNLDRRIFVKQDGTKGDAYTYDATDQVIGIKYGVSDPDGAASNPARTVAYDYDAAGNRLTVTDNGAAIAYTPNNLNQYLTVSRNTLAYTANGNLKNFNGWAYFYDAQNRLIKATNGITTVFFEYDCRNRCVKRIVNGQIIFLYYDDWNLIEERNVDGSQIARYIHGTRIDEILSKTSTTGTVYYHHDALGSVTQLTNTLGNVVERYSYDVFGVPTIKKANGNVLPSTAYSNRFLFTGREFIQEIGLYEYRNRMYLESLGRFLQTDPLRFDAGDYNLYRYVGNSPVIASDKFGLASSVTGELEIGIDKGGPSVKIKIGGTKEFSGEQQEDNDKPWRYPGDPGKTERDQKIIDIKKAINKEMRDALDQLEKCQRICMCIEDSEMRAACLEGCETWRRVFRHLYEKYKSIH